MRRQQQCTMFYLSPLLLLQTLLLLQSACPASSAQSLKDGRLRYAPKSKQASPGLYFDPASGTFRERPPEPTLVGVAGDGDFLAGDVVAAEKEEEEYAEHALKTYPLLSARGAGLALAGQYDPSRAAAYLHSRTRNGNSNSIGKVNSREFDDDDNEIEEDFRARKRLRGRIRSRGRSIENDGAERQDDEKEHLDRAESTRYRHYSNPNEVILRSGANKYLVDDRFSGEKKSYDYMIGDDEDDDEEQNLIDVITPFSTSTFRPVSYDFAIGGGGSREKGISTPKPGKRPPLVPTVRAGFRRESSRFAATTTTTAAPPTTTATTASPVYPTPPVTWAPSGPRLHKGTTKYPRLQSLRWTKAPQPTKRRKVFRPKTDKEKIRKRFLDHAASLSGDGRNEVAEKYPQMEGEKFPHFPAQSYKTRPVIERPEGGPTGTNRDVKAPRGHERDEEPVGNPWQDLEEPRRRTTTTAATTTTTRSSVLELRRKTPRFDASGADFDSFSTHSSSQNTFLPFENIRLQQRTKKSRLALPERNEIKSDGFVRHRVRTTTASPTTTPSPRPTFGPDPNWGKKVEGEEEQGRRLENVVVKTRERRPTAGPALLVTTPFEPLFPRRTTGATATPSQRPPFIALSTVRPRTAATTTTRRPRTSLPRSSSSNLVEPEFDSESSPFSSIPVDATPKTFLKHQSDASWSKGGSGSKVDNFEFPPLFQPQPTAFTGYAAPDLYGKTVPRAKNHERVAQEQSEKKPSGFSYSDYFGYGVPTSYPPATEKSSRRGHVSVTTTPTPATPFPKIHFSPQKTHQPRATRAPQLPAITTPFAVTVRPYGEPEPTQRAFPFAKEEVQRNRLPEEHSKHPQRSPSSRPNYGQEERRPDGFERDPYDFHASPTERSYVAVTRPPKLPSVSYQEQRIFSGGRGREDNSKFTRDWSAQKRPDEGPEERDRDWDAQRRPKASRKQVQAGFRQERENLRREYEEVMRRKKKALERLRQSQLNIDIPKQKPPAKPQRQQQKQKEQHYYRGEEDLSDFYFEEHPPQRSHRKKKGSKNDLRHYQQGAEDEHQQQHLQEKMRRFYLKKQEQDIRRIYEQKELRRQQQRQQQQQQPRHHHHQQQHPNRRRPKSTSPYSRSSTSGESFDPPLPRFPSFAEFSRDVAPAAFPKLGYFPNFE